MIGKTISHYKIIEKPGKSGSSQPCDRRKTMKLLRETPGMRYELFDLSARDEMARLVSKVFIGYEPMAVAQKLSQKEFIELDELDGQYKQKREITFGEYLHVFIAAIDQRRNGERIAQTLIEVCLENGIRQGYKTAVTEATGPISQHVFRKLGFVDRHEILYKTFAYEGRQVFESIPGHTGTILLDKVLT